MNERFLSRGKRKDNGEWVTGYYVFQRKRSGVFGQKISELDFDRHLIIDLRGNSHEVIPETVVRCTGLKDKNGKPIFEGDILKFVNDDREISLYVVIWNTSLLSWQVQEISHYVKNDYCGFDELCEFGNTEVIGNIHDNPKLLQRSDEE